jgi:hypothetical protein
MRLLICGGRDLDEDCAYFCLLSFGYGKPLATEIIHGGARGADSAAGLYARTNGIVETVFEADWKRYGKAAGMIRNKKMLTSGQPDAILALSGGKGTANMMKIGREAGIPVFELECK